MNPPFQQVPSIKWIPPPCNLVKLNFDGFVCHNKKAAAGFVVRDHEGNPILAGSRCVCNSSVPIAECSALRDDPPPPWRLRTILSDVCWMAFKFEDITFKYVPQEANFVADAMASLGHQVQNQTL
ncbi:hypothetical protein ACLB2K_010354 [Fragaria x ananassa]